MRSKNTLGFLCIMILSMTLWGGSWVSAKLVTDAYSPQIIIFWRFLFTTLSLAPVLPITSSPFKTDIKAMFYSAAGALLLVIYNFLFFTGLRVGLAGAGGVLVTTTNPLFTFLILSVFLKTKLKINEFIGIFLGLLGGLTIIGVWNADPQIIFQKGNILFLIASFVWALLTITSRKGISIGTPYMTYSFYLYLFCTLFSFPFALKHNILKPLDAGISFWMNIIFLSTIVTAFATTTYFYASNRLGSGKASSFIFLVPLSAMLLSWLILNEQPAISTIIGGVMALSAVYMINIKTSKLNK